MASGATSATPVCRVVATSEVSQLLLADIGDQVMTDTLCGWLERFMIRGWQVFECPHMPWWQWVLLGAFALFFIVGIGIMALEETWWRRTHGGRGFWIR